MQNVLEPTAAAPAGARSVWSRVIPFIALTFGLTWLLDLAILLNGGLAKPSTLVALQLQMLLPAASAILLGFVSTRYGSARVRESTGQARWFCYFFLAFTGLYIALSVLSLASPDLAPALTGAGSVLAILSLLALVALRLAKGRDSFVRAGLTFGKPVHWLLYGIPVVAFYAAMTALNAAFGLGAAPDLGPYLQATPMPVEAFLVAGAIQTVMLGPLLGLVIAFGEEYGWRGFLQGELIRLGRVKGILAVGVIWGLWHAPIIAMGYNFPGYPIAGIFQMIAFCVVLGFVLGYAVLKTGSVWLAAFLHALSNQTVAFLVAIIYAPRDALFQFDGGIYGAIIGALIVLLILRDPIWKAREGVPPSTTISQHDGGSAAMATER
jgi:uncharacterized protein